jgi:hypothetical protein
MQIVVRNGDSSTKYFHFKQKNWWILGERLIMREMGLQIKCCRIEAFCMV